MSSKIQEQRTTIKKRGKKKKEKNSVLVIFVAVFFLIPGILTECEQDERTDGHSKERKKIFGIL